MEGKKETCYQCEGAFVLGKNGSECVELAKAGEESSPESVALAYVIESPALPSSPYTIASDDVERLKKLEE